MVQSRGLWHVRCAHLPLATCCLTVSVLGAWDDRYPTRLLNSRTVSIEHHDNGGRTAGSGKGVVPEAVITASIALDALLLRGDLAELKAAGVRFRAGTEAAMATLAAVELRPLLRICSYNDRNFGCLAKLHAAI